MNTTHIQTFFATVLMCASLFGIASLSASAQAEEVQSFGTSSVSGSIGAVTRTDH